MGWSWGINPEFTKKPKKLCIMARSYTRRRKPIVPEPKDQEQNPYMNTGERDFDAAAKMGSEMYEKGKADRKRVGTGKGKKKGKSSGSGAVVGMGGGPTCADGVDGCDVAFALNPIAWVAKAAGAYNTDQKKRGGPSYKGSSDPSKSFERSYERSQNILEGNFGENATESYKRMAQEKEYDRVSAKSQLNDLRTKLKNNEITLAEYKKARQQVIDAKRAKSAQSSSDYRESYQAERSGDQDSSLSMSSGGGRRGVRVRSAGSRGPRKEQLVYLRSKSPNLR